MTEESKEPDWKAIAEELAKHLVFTVENLRAVGSGLLRRGGVIKHWKEHFADSLDKVPGVKIDREIMHAYSLPERERNKRFKQIDAERAQSNAG